ncbi:Pycsar system effector family protein [Psychroserpens sp.]|uniref:Pycsar system effector family protein n=1 Tax=Psychroserpens sp. TaxID=2020870 RepID=UPI00385F96B2
MIQEEPTNNSDKSKKKNKQDPGVYFRQLGRLEKLNKSSEVKAGVVFSFHSLIIGLFADRMDYFKGLFDENPLIIVFTALWIISALISIFFAFKCFKPIIINLKYDDNVFFFGDVVSKFGSIEAYVKRVFEVNEDKIELFDQLAQQMHVESTIVATKFKNVQNAIKFFMFSVLFIVLTIITIAFT